MRCSTLFSSTVCIVAAFLLLIPRMPAIAADKISNHAVLIPGGDVEEILSAPIDEKEFNEHLRAPAAGVEK